MGQGCWASAEQPFMAMQRRIEMETFVVDMELMQFVRMPAAAYLGHEEHAQQVP